MLSLRRATAIALSSREYSGIDIYSDKDLSDLGYADDVVLLSDDTSKLQIFPYRLNDSIGKLGMRFASSE